MTRPGFRSAGLISAHHACAAAQHHTHPSAAAKTHLERRYEAARRATALEIHRDEQPRSHAVARFGARTQPSAKREPVRALPEGIEQEADEQIRPRIRASRRRRVCARRYAHRAIESDANVETHWNLRSGAELHGGLVTGNHVEPQLGLHGGTRNLRTSYGRNAQERPHRRERGAPPAAHRARARQSASV